MNSTQLVRLCSLADVPEGGGKSFKVGGQHLAVFRTKGKIYVTGGICSHEHEFLSDGWLDGEIVECPRHGAQFSLVTGEALSLPATEPIAVFDVKIVGADVFIDLPTENLDA